MFKKPLYLYVSTASWFAMSGSATDGCMSGESASPVSETWKAVGAALLTHFHAPHRVSVVVSARQCRFLVLPWLSSCYTGGAIRRYVVEAFAERHGVSAESHHVEITWPRYGESIGAVAYPRGLVDDLRSGLGHGGHDVTSVVVSVYPVLRKYGGGIGAEHALLAYAEDDGVTAVSTENGGIAQVETLWEEGGGLDQLEVWSSRKRFGFARDGQMRWLTSTEMPGVFPGTTLPLIGLSKPVCPGHGVLSACL